MLMDTECNVPIEAFCAVLEGISGLRDMIT